MIPRWSLTLLCAVGLAIPPAETRMQFGPAEGVKISKVFEGTFNANLEDARMTMNGQDFPLNLSEADPSDLEGEFGYEMTVVDQFNGVDEGRITDLLRTYESIEGHYDMAGDSDDQTFEDLEGQSVHFVWDDESASYKRTPQDEDAEIEEDLLKSLAVELDMTALLPPGEVAVGDTWEVPGRALAALLVPGIDFAAASEVDSDAASEIPADLLEDLENSMEEAVIECKFDGLNGDGENAVAVIAFTLTSDVSLDLTDAVAQQMEEQGTEMQMALDELTLDLGLELTGELLWNVQGGHFDSYEVGGEVSVDVYLTMAMGDGQMEMEGEAEGSLEFNVEGTATVQ